MSTTTKRNKTEKLKKTLLVTIATINVLNNIAPLAIPGVQLIAEATKQTRAASTAPAIAYQIIENGGQLLDSLLFSKAEAFTDPVTTYVQNETVESGVQNVVNGGTAVSISINSAGFQNISNGGTAIENAINANGRQNISSGGISNKTIINSSGTQNIFSGGTTNSDTVNNVGVQYINSGGVANATTVSAGGFQVLLSGRANDTVISASGRQNISSAGVAFNNTIIGGTQSIGSGGTALSTTIASGGKQFAFQSGTAISTTLNAGGVQEISGSGTIASVTIMHSGANQFVGSNAVAKDVTINNGAVQYIDSTGQANSVTINSGGLQFVSRGGTALNVVQNSGGEIRTIVDGTDNTKLISGSNANGNFSLSNGIADNFIIYANGSQSVSSGGTANNTTVDVNGIQDLRHNGTLANSTTVNGGTQHVFDSSLARNTIINDGVQIVNRGGTAVSNTINSNGLQEVRDNAIADFTTLNGGYQKVFRTGVASNTTINESGLQVVFNGASADVTTINNGGTQTVDSSIATNTVINSGGTQRAFNGGNANSTIINTGGLQNLTLGARASDTTINGGIQNVDAGTSATSTTINDGGVQLVQSSGNSIDTIVNSGGLQIASDGARITNTTVNSAGQLNLHSNVVFSGTLSNEGLVVLNGFNDEIITNLTGNKGTLAFNAPGSTATYDKKLNIVNLSGSQTFEISADLLNNQADSLIVGGARGAHYIRVTKEASPSGNLLKLKGAATVVELLGGGDATFQGVKSNIEGVVIEPQLELNGNLWQLTGYAKIGASDLAKVALGAANMTYATLYAGENNIKRRLGDVSNNLDDAGVWLRTYGGQYSVDRDNLKYVMVQGGYDKVNKVQGGHTLTGITIDHLSGNTAYAAGASDGKTRNTRLGLYHAWLGDSGQYYDITVRTGRMNSKVNTHETDKISGSYSAWNTGISAEYGYKKELKNGAYITPQAELFVGRINAAKYLASDGTAINQHVLNSMMLRLGLSIGKKTDRTDVYFTTSVMHEFAAKNSVTTGSGDFASRLERDLRGTSLEAAFGGSFKSGKNGLFYTEATRSFGGKIINKWQLQAGYRFGF